MIWFSINFEVDVPQKPNLSTNSRQKKSTKSIYIYFGFYKRFLGLSHLQVNIYCLLYWFIFSHRRRDSLFHNT